MSFKKHFSHIDPSKVASSRMTAAEFRQLNQSQLNEPTVTSRVKGSNLKGAVTNQSSVVAPAWHVIYTKEISRLRSQPERLSSDKEYFYQVQLMESIAQAYPELEKLVNASPNGGSRNRFEAARLKFAGLCKGFPDIQVCVARSGFNALFIELKKELSDYRSLKAALKEVSFEQHRCRVSLLEQGSLAVVAYGYDEAWRVFQAYIAGGELPDEVLSRWDEYDWQLLAKR
ncbi:hypothetical protein [Vibrio agarivorans]|uniref:VRR-NUC domain-containing protein n=1 Tax=Vibrio agarivorans TaxID=153622 RepID=A0ABT7Y7V9_9VIBR|nr:hypothetical protein [Vibrio agarivorans]MDN2483844.1 hypothetical protein [Vibrio agarivorans]